MKKIIILSFFFSSWLLPIKTVIYDTPTALTLEQGQYSINSFFYSGGGLYLKVGFGLHKAINLGVGEYVDSILGKDKMSWKIPNASIKVRFTDLPDDSHNVAVGFDSFYNGSLSPFNKKIYGPYLVYTYGFNFDNEHIIGPQLVSLGIRYPVIYEQGSLNMFTSIYFNLFTYFNFGLEFENIHFAKQYLYYFILNNIITFKASEEFQVSFVLQMGVKEPKSGQETNIDFARDLRLTFESFF